MAQHLFFCNLPSVKHLLNSHTRWGTLHFIKSCKKPGTNCHNLSEQYVCVGPSNSAQCLTKTKLLKWQN